MRVAPLRLMRHIDEHAMSYMNKMSHFLNAECSLAVHDGCFGARAHLFDAEFVPRFTVTPLLDVDGNLRNSWRAKW